MKTTKSVKLEGLSEKIFLDRYALKNPDTSQAKVGDVVLVLTKDDPKFPTKEVGEIVERKGNEVKVKLRNGDIVDSDITQLTLNIEKTPEEMWIGWPKRWHRSKQRRKNRRNGRKSLNIYCRIGSWYPEAGSRRERVRAMN